MRSRCWRGWSWAPTWATCWSTDLPRYHPELLEIEELRRIVAAEGAVAVQAHPMRYRPGRQPGWEEMRAWFDGVEVVNGDHSDTVGGYHHTQALELGLAAVGGSDAHSRQAVGRVATAVPGYVASVYDVVRYISERSTQPVDMRPPRSAGMTAAPVGGPPPPPRSLGSGRAPPGRGAAGRMR